MTVSSSYNFEQNREELIKDALANLGALGPDGTPSGAQTIHAGRALNRVVKSIDPEGQFLWRVVRRTFNTTSGTATATPAADVISIDEPMSYLPAASGSTRTVLHAMSRHEYMILPDRTTAGKPTRFFFERTMTTNTVTMYPVPDTTGDTVEYSAILKSRDLDEAADTPDFPAQWNACLVYGLTSELAPVYGATDVQLQMFRQVFMEEKNKLLSAETEHGRVILVPFGGSW